MDLYWTHLITLRAWNNPSIPPLSFLLIYETDIELIFYPSKKDSSFNAEEGNTNKKSDESGIIPIIEVMTVRSLIWISLTSPLPTTSSTKITGQIGYNLTYPSIQPAHDPKAIQHGAGREMKGPTGGPSPAWSKEIGCYDRIAVPSAMMSASFHSMKGSERQVKGVSWDYLTITC